MIRINRPHIWKEIEYEHRIYIASVVKKYFMKEVSCSTELQEIVKTIYPKKTLDMPAMLQDICFCENIFDINTKYQTFFTNNPKAIEADIKEEIKEEINEILCYGDFVRKKEGWCRTIFLKKLDVNVCPYCNRQYITNFSERATADIDHYIPQTECPLLALNIYNMIPSCQICNSRLKNKTEKRHFYPYSDNEECFNFYYDDDKKSLKLDISNDKNGHATNSNEIFHIGEIYEQNHTVHAEEVRSNTIHYTEDYSKYYNKILKNLPIDYEYYEQALFPFKQIDDNTTEPLLKMKKDIYAQYNIKEIKNNCK